MFWSSSSAMWHASSQPRCYTSTSAPTSGPPPKCPYGYPIISLYWYPIMLSYWDPIVLLYGNLITGRYIYWCRALEVNCHKICFTTVLIYLKTRSLERPYWCLNSRESDGIKNILSTIGNTLPPGQRGGLCPAYDTVCNQPTDLRGIRPKLPQVSTNWRCNHLVQRVINQRTKRIVGTTCSSSGEII